MIKKRNRAKHLKRSDTNIVKHKLESLCGLLLTLCSLLVVDLSDEPNVTLPKRIIYLNYIQGYWKTCIVAKQEDRHKKQ